MSVPPYPPRVTSGLLNPVLALDLYRAEDTTGTEVREAALLLARLRSRADSRRDTYLRAALG